MSIIKVVRKEGIEPPVLFRERIYSPVRPTYIRLLRIQNEPYSSSNDHVIRSLL